MQRIYGNVPYLLRRSANKAREGGSMLIRFLESTFFLKICKRARGGPENAGDESCILSR